MSLSLVYHTIGQTMYSIADEMYGLIFYDSLMCVFLYFVDPLAAGNPVHAIACATRYSGWGHAAPRNTLVTGGSCFAYVWFWGDLVQVVAHPSAGWKYVSIRRDFSLPPCLAWDVSLSRWKWKVWRVCQPSQLSLPWTVMQFGHWSFELFWNDSYPPCAVDKQDKLAAGLVQLAQGPQSQACAA